MQVYLTHLCRVDYSTSALWTGIFSKEGVSGKFLLIACFLEIPICNASTVDPDQALRSVASDLGQHCLPMSLLWDARHKWVKISRLWMTTAERFQQIIGIRFLCGQ